MFPWLQRGELARTIAFMIDCHEPKGPWNCLLGQWKELSTAVFTLPTHSLKEWKFIEYLWCTKPWAGHEGAEQWPAQPWPKPHSCGDTHRHADTLWGLMCLDRFQRIFTPIPTPDLSWLQSPFLQSEIIPPSMHCCEDYTKDASYTVWHKHSYQGRLFSLSSVTMARVQR